MIHIAMPLGSTFGWGVCGKYISREVSAIRPGQMRLITPPFTLETIGDELEYNALVPLAAVPIQNTRQVNGITHLDGPLLSAIVNEKLESFYPILRGTRTLGYTFFENNVLQPEWIEHGRRSFDAIATGSSWCTQVLREQGLTDAHTVIQGIDPRIFFPPASDTGAEREFLRDRFVIFSGGKFEIRKGQDIAIRAVKVLQDRHLDVVLVNAWYNPWPKSFETMRGSPHLKWPNFSGQYAEAINQLLGANGLDLSRVLTIGARPNALMARIYRNTDVGLFPNRCEGGTNLVLMEYMGCGKPVIATATTGHSDVIRAEHAQILATPSENTLSGPSGSFARWPEPSLDDAIEKLEWAYQHRDELKAMGTRAGKAMAEYTWTRTAREFLKLLEA